MTGYVTSDGTRFTPRPPRQPADFKAADIRIGQRVGYDGTEWSVWAKGPAAGTFWLAEAGNVHPDPVHVRDLRALLTPEHRGQS